MSFKTISEDQFHDEFKPVDNHITENSSFNGKMFETYGADFEFVQSQDPSKVWTIVEGEEMTYSSGLHFVNRIGYFVCEVPVPEGTDIEVNVDDDLDRDEEGNIID